MKRKNWKSFHIILFEAILILLIFSINLDAAEYKIRVANPVAPDHSWGRAAVVFKGEVEKLNHVLGFHQNIYEGGW